jgi:succinyl-CoA synthetase beta subunit
MLIHEYQAKEVLRGYKVPTSSGYVAFSADEAEVAASKLPGPLYVVKAQIHAGGRGKGGGVKVVKSVAEAKEVASKMLGMTLITHQTGPAGKEVKRVYIEEASDIDKELYMSLLVDRETSQVTFIASEEGGVNIEEVASDHPEKIITLGIDPAIGMRGYHALQLAKKLRLPKEQFKAFSQFVMRLYDAFVGTDASQVEINPLVRTKQGQFIALDAKLNFDDNALFRHADIAEMRDTAEEEPLETRATEAGLSYVKMDGTIGCMVNGAGLAMATMDIIKLYGAEPANFLDVGGGATRERVTEAFKIILSDPNVNGILVNIFGGIMRCDIIANGIVEAAREVSLSIPLVVRLAGTNVDLGKEILSKSGLKIIPADDLAEAAERIVHAVKEGA